MIEDGLLETLELIARLVEAVRAQRIPVATGRFAGDMKVSLINDGPATFILDTAAA